MENLSALVPCLLLTLGAASAQDAPAHTNNRPLPQWLTGIIAVSGFLFLSFVVLLVKKAWCEDPQRKENDMEKLNEVLQSNPYDTSLDVRRRKNSVESGKGNEFTDNSYDTSLDVIRSKDDVNAFNNIAMDVIEDKATAM